MTTPLSIELVTNLKQEIQSLIARAIYYGQATQTAPDDVRITASQALQESGRNTQQYLDVLEGYVRRRQLSLTLEPLVENEQGAYDETQESRR